MAIAPTSDTSLPEDGLDRFAYVASHDMAEPLRMVSGYLDLIRESYADQLDADFEEFIQLAVDGVERMHAYLMSLRTYSRIGRLENVRSRSTSAISSTRPCAGCDRISRRPGRR
jgi:light-regulated signal transduction histidine kinase (bacteriophytochrome)